MSCPSCVHFWVRLASVLNHCFYLMSKFYFWVALASVLNQCFCFMSKLWPFSGRACYFSVLNHCFYVTSKLCPFWVALAGWNTVQPREILGFLDKMFPLSLFFLVFFSSFSKRVFLLLLWQFCSETINCSFRCQEVGHGSHSSSFSREVLIVTGDRLLLLVLSF